MSSFEAQLWSKGGSPRAMRSILGFHIYCEGNVHCQSRQYVYPVISMLSDCIILFMWTFGKFFWQFTHTHRGAGACRLADTRVHTCSPINQHFGLKETNGSLYLGVRLTDCSLWTRTSNIPIKAESGECSMEHRWHVFKSVWACLRWGEDDRMRA